MSVRWETDPDLLYPWFRQAVDDLLRGGPYVWVVVDGYRTLDEQGIRQRRARAAESGPRLPPPGRTPHNFGCAVHIYSEHPEHQPYDIRSRAWPWLRDHLPQPHPLLWHGREAWRWHHIEWRRWRDIAWGEAAS